MIQRTTYQNTTATCIWPVPLVQMVGSRALPSEAGEPNVSGIGHLQSSISESPIVVVVTVVLNRWTAVLERWQTNRAYFPISLQPSGAWLESTENSTPLQSQSQPSSYRP